MPASSPPNAAQASVEDPIQFLGSRFIDAVRAAFPAVEGLIDPMIAASRQPEFGDFQSNIAMSLAKKLGAKPRDVATAIIAKLDLGSIAEPLTEKSIAGPGFINIRLRASALSELLESIDNLSLGIVPAAETQTVVVDLMGVNLSKQMHVGHLRSPVIGDAIARALERLGHKVLRQNHVGDWGLPIAMVTARLMRQAAGGEINLNTITLDQLDAAYKAAQAECQRDMEGLAAATKYNHPKAVAELQAQVDGATESFTQARQTLIKLQTHEPATFAVWQRIADVTMAVCLAVCKRLHVNVTAEHSAGESSYAAELAPMVAELESRGIATIDRGALVIHLEDPQYGGIKEPCLMRKTDGGYLYATTDVAGIRRRVRKLHADRLVYVIDARQSLHMRQVFGASVRAGYATNLVTGKVAVMQHAAFGAVLGDDGRPFKTRSGDNVNLQSLIDEAVERAYSAVKLRADEDATKANRTGEAANESELRARAEIIGVVAMKYADLVNDRVRDYAFSFDRMLAFEGNTGPYLLYAYARIRNIFRKAAERGVDSGWSSAPFKVAEPAEKTLALQLIRYNAAVRGVADEMEPHRLCQYLYDLAGAFSTFYDQCPVLQAEQPDKILARLRLCDLTARVLADGLNVLGMPTLDRM